MPKEKRYCTAGRLAMPSLSWLTQYAHATIQTMVPNHTVCSAYFSACRARIQWTAGISPYEYTLFLKKLHGLVTTQVPIYTADGELLGYASIWKNEEDCGASVACTLNRA